MTTYLVEYETFDGAPGSCYVTADDEDSAVYTVYHNDQYLTVKKATECVGRPSHTRVGLVDRIRGWCGQRL